MEVKVLGGVIGYLHYGQGCGVGFETGFGIGRSQLFWLEPESVVFSDSDADPE